MEGTQINKIGGAHFGTGDIFSQIIKAVNSFLGFGAYDAYAYNPCAYDPAALMPVMERRQLDTSNPIQQQQSPQVTEVPVVAHGANLQRKQPQVSVVSLPVEAPVIVSASNPIQQQSPPQDVKVAEGCSGVPQIMVGSPPTALPTQVILAEDGRKSDTGPKVTEMPMVAQESDVLQDPNQTRGRMIRMLKLIVLQNQQIHAFRPVGNQKILLEIQATPTTE
ncbi:hypothetical protein BIW11_07178 [Tropilaelaps mercedesae]|uniref:Uncharacterized protein n=1 Tax=Tropilaelaps mercedesae TaxID=418985 RepID=A0A1V9XV58_9ACAR|nr:hypothetical protein BIW11_07178 [Tropilaelaps mercedesae]